MVKGLTVRGPIRPGYEQILSNEALTFLAELHRNFDERRRSLLAARVKRQAELDAGKKPGFLPETEHIRKGAWKGASLAKDLTDRRVEITGPVDRKMVINALNSGAKVFMADFEDATAPTWDNMVSGQYNLRDAIRRTISFSAGGKEYKLKPDGQLATLMARPRGWHLLEEHVLVDGQPMSGSLFDFGLYFFHNAKELLKRGSGPYFYLPKMESHLEARLWNDVFVYSQKRLGVPHGSVRATVLIETILAAFEMEEIIYELRDHSAGLNCGRWDYIFSFIKKFRNHADAVLPDRVLVTMEAPWMAAYVRLLIQTCHRRGVHAMGGMAAQIPISGNAAANSAAFDKVRADKLREVKAGCDGTWVAHPGLIPVAVGVFNQHMQSPNQIHRVGDTSAVQASDLLNLGPKGTITLTGVRNNINVSLGYLEAWLRGNGCVPLHNLMEDAATAEISRCQVWQWIKHGAALDSGVKIDKALVQKVLLEEVDAAKKGLTPAQAKARKFDHAGQLLAKLLLSDQLEDFLTSFAYPYITSFTTKSKL